MADIFLDFLLIWECEFLFPSPLMEESLQCPNVQKKDADLIKGCGGSHFYNNWLKNLLEEYGVVHTVENSYHPQTSGQVEVSKGEIKKILAKRVNANRMNGCVNEAR